MGDRMEKKNGTLLIAKIFKKKSYKLVLLLFSYCTTVRGGRGAEIMYKL